MQQKVILEQKNSIQAVFLHSRAARAGLSVRISVLVGSATPSMGMAGKVATCADNCKKTCIFLSFLVPPLAIATGGELAPPRETK